MISRMLQLQEDATKDDMEGVDAIVLQRAFRVLAKLYCSLFLSCNFFFYIDIKFLAGVRYRKICIYHVFVLHLQPLLQQ